MNVVTPLLLCFLLAPMNCEEDGLRSGGEGNATNEGRGTNAFEPMRDDASVHADKESDCDLELDDHCRDVCLSYINFNVESAYCTRRVKERFTSGFVRKGVFYYWYVQNCFSFVGAQQACAIAGGEVASFTDGADRAFGASYLSGLLNRGGYCYSPSQPDAASPNMNLVWAGLTSATSNSPWVWEDGSKISRRHPVPWNSDLGFHLKTRMYKSDNEKLCAVMGWNGVASDIAKYGGGFDSANCGLAAKTVCVKEIH